MAASFYIIGEKFGEGEVGGRVGGGGKGMAVSTSGTIQKSKHTQVAPVVTVINPT